MKSLEGKWALITGSSRGIGQQVAIGLAERKCNIIVHGREKAHLNNTLNMLSKYKVKVHFVVGDLATEEGVNSVIKGVKTGSISLDILYNNAAIMNKWKPVWEITKQEWLETFQVNLFAMIALCNAFAPDMKKRGYGRIINVTSGIKDTPNLAPYSVSKAAVDKYTRDLAAELKETNVLVNCMDPGWLKTDLGGPKADHEVETVLPGALIPVLLDDNGPSGKLYSAQEFRDSKI